MTTTALETAPMRRMTNMMKLLLQRPARRQVAALCYREQDGDLKVLLITSRDTKRWILPKGWPATKRSARKQAEREAFEEAGVNGKSAREPIAEYRSFKGLDNGLKMPTDVTVFALKVTGLAKKYPERGERDLAWFTLEEAANTCGDPGLAKVLLSPETKKRLSAA